MGKNRVGDFFQALSQVIYKAGPEDQRWSEVFDKAQKKVLPVHRQYKRENNPKVFVHVTIPFAEAMARKAGVILHQRPVDKSVCKSRQKTEWWVSLTPSRYVALRKREEMNPTPEPLPKWPKTPEEAAAQENKTEPEVSVAPVVEIEPVQEIPIVPSTAMSAHDADSALVHGIVSLLGDWMRNSMRIVVDQALGSRLDDIRQSINVIKADMADVLLGNLGPQRAVQQPSPSGPDPEILGHDKKRKPVILCWNMKAHQLKEVRLNVPEAKIIGNSDTVKIGTAPKADLVITSKFVSHSQESLLFSRYGKEKVKHVSGGTSGMIAMAKNFISSL